MLQITISPPELWDEEKQEFISIKSQTLQLEHSLVSISKWESKWHKPFLTKEPKTFEETVDYIKCMTLTQNVKSEIYNYLSRENFKEVDDYIANPMTATTFSKEPSGKSSREQITSELVYYWMISLNIPVDFQKWHLNRLLTLIRVCNVKNAPPKKGNKSDVARNYAALNAARRKKYNTRG